jgi:hypothetical protein
MRVGAIVFRLLLALGWAVLFYVSVQAIRLMGVGAAGTVFVADFAHPWRAQFNTDFSLHLLLVAAWMVYRSRPWFVGLICGVLAINLGGVFTLAYLLAVSIRAKGDMRKVLLGWRAETAAA